MKVKDVTMYTCDHCGKRLIRKHAMIKHEENCLQNPENIPACYNCNYCEQVDIEYYTFDYEGYDHEHKSTCLKCTKKDILMYSPKAKRLAEKYQESFEDQSECPKNCEHQKTFVDTLSDNDLILPWETKEDESC